MMPMFLSLRTSLTVRELSSFAVTKKSHVVDLNLLKSATKDLLMSAKICTRAVLTIGASTSPTFTKVLIPMLTAQSKQKSSNTSTVLNIRL